MAAQRLLRLLPAGNFYQWLESLPKSNTFEACDISFVAETAIYYYYNRIVEYDGSFPLDKATRGWLDGNYNDGVAWIKLAASKLHRFDVYSALLDFGYGLVLWDHNDKLRAQGYFRNMLKTVQSSKDVYPSNPHHIAVALREVFEPGYHGQLAPAGNYDPNEIEKIGSNYVSDGRVIVLFAIPDKSGKSIGKVETGHAARVYLRSVRWDLLQARGQLGWAQRTAATSEN